MNLKINDNDLNRFFSKIKSFGHCECWEWIGGKDKNGYGKIKIKRKHLRAHRVSIYIEGVRFNDSDFICHSCDNPGCVNPNHLWVGTPEDNSHDMIEKKRQHNQKKTHCIRGHKLVGSRRCKICSRIHANKSYYKNIIRAKKYNKKYRIINKERLDKYAKEYRDKNKEKILEYRIKNRDILNEKKRLKRLEAKNENRSSISRS